MNHPVGDHNHQSYFLQNQIPVIRMERSTDFFRIIIATPWNSRPLYVVQGGTSIACAEHPLPSTTTGAHFTLSN
ncbi:MAG: hypothetical protein P8179_23520 [Candidatus Thiodiazotropha sp.]